MPKLRNILAVGTRLQKVRSSRSLELLCIKVAVKEATALDCSRARCLKGRMAQLPGAFHEANSSDHGSNRTGRVMHGANPSRQQSNGATVRRTGCTGSPHGGEAIRGPATKEQVAIPIREEMRFFRGSCVDESANMRS